MLSLELVPFESHFVWGPFLEFEEKLVPFGPYLVPPQTDILPLFARPKILCMYVIFPIQRILESSYP